MIGKGKGAVLVLFGAILFCARQVKLSIILNENLQWIEYDVMPAEKNLDKNVTGSGPRTAVASNMPKRFFSVPWNFTKFFLGLYPELQNAVEIHLNKDNYMNYTYASNDFLVMGYHGPLKGIINEAWLDQNFPGTTVIVNHESFHFRYMERPQKQVPTYQRIFYFGPQYDSNRTMQLPAICSLVAQENLDTQQLLYDPSRKPINSQERFVIYVASHCVGFRMQAFQALSTIDTAYYGARCIGMSKFNNGSVKQDSNFREHSWRNNEKLFGRYKFCLVMENCNVDGYITEKILSAWKGGCVPIYYGTRDVFKLFNHQAFVYYDVKDPMPAFERIKHLHHNQTAYNEVLAEPILADGNRTIEEYFSLSDDVGGGKLKNRIRNFIHAVRREYVTE